MITRVLVIAGAASGVGKTTITLGLLDAYRRRGLAVQAFKIGPDFIDPGLHEIVTGRPSYNLDGWMCGREHAVATVHRRGAHADLLLIEGVMGCFDGADATSDDGSTAQIAKWLGAAVVLVVDASSQARSAAAVVQGFERFDPDVRIAAVIANRVGGALHGRMIADALRAYCKAVPVGAVPRDESLLLPERHLGLVTAAEGPLTEAYRANLARAVEASVDLDRLLALATPLSTGGAARGSEGERVGKAGVRPFRAKLGVARDAAFQFYYAENLELLRAVGAELVFWSPLRDTTLPDVDGLYFGGGYPELHARQLSDNVGMVKAVADFGAAGRPIYAECGGLMYLAEALEDMAGIPHRMVGLLPTTIHMVPPRLTIGYTEVQLTGDTPLGAAGTVGRGHEFHCSRMDTVPDSVRRVYRLQTRHGETCEEGYLVGRALMSYVHLHFGSNPELARRLVDACAR